MSIRLFAAALAVQLAAAGLARSAPPPTLEALQEQVEALKAGQQQLLEELRDIKQLLQAPPARQEVAAIPETPPVITQNVRGEPFRGEATARVAIVEYSDFNCSYCKQFTTNIFPLVERDYVRTGKVKYLFRDLPDKHDADSLVKAQAARCAGEQGKFWEMHDRLFVDQSPLLKDPERVNLHVQLLNLDAKKFNTCLQSGRYVPAIQKIAANAQRFGMHGTPAFLIGRMSENGDVVWGTKLVHGAESYDEFRAVLDEFFAEPPK